ncbi:probable cytochrome P450 6a14 [Frankliniella occidentalis]|uniref:Probable cytochrome P450 6a14 n=1 Tax=Frankliniella occidentalis TaxID=133901 RepID=A0A9C6X669_FRAOC|nr:probable cytochrome P450 6a14 [Frankliniella occidentalis]
MTNALRAAACTSTSRNLPLETRFCTSWNHPIGLNERFYPTCVQGCSLKFQNPVIGRSPTGPRQSDFAEPPLQTKLGTVPERNGNLFFCVRFQFSRTVRFNPSLLQVEFKDILLRYSTDVIGSVAFGIDCNTVKGGNDDFLNMSRELFRRNFIFLLRFFLISVHPVFVKLLPFKRIFKDMTEFFLKLMSDTVNYREKNKVERNDFVQIMMQLREEDRNRSTLDRASHVELNNDTMAAQAFLFFVAGLDNVANTIGFALHELAMNHALQRRAVAEIQENIRKHGSLTYDAVRDMELIERIVRESLRKYSPVGILTRQPSEPIKIPDSDVVIDPSVMVWIPVWQAMHDPDIFPEPERFDPDRFTEEAKKTRHQYNYLPFGEGPRFCVAERFAILEMKLCIAGLLQQHAFDAGSKTDVKLKLDPKTSSPTPQNGFWLQVTDRPTSAL